MAPPLLRVGQVVDPATKLWTVQAHLGSGDFGAVYRVKNGKGEEAAAKVSHRYDELKVELDIYQHINNKSIFLPRIIAYGNKTIPHFIIITLEGRTLDDLQSSSPDCCLSPRDVMRYSADCVRALQSLHSFDYVHRDIKGDNLAEGLSLMRAPVVILDLGLAKYVRTVDGRRQYPRHDKTNRCDCVFSSPRVARRRSYKELDDLFSLMYTMLDSRNALNFDVPAEQLLQKKIDLNEHPERHLEMHNHFMAPFIKVIASMSYSRLPDYQAVLQGISDMEPLIRADEEKL